MVFREHDNKLFHKLRPAYRTADEGYVQATRASRETFENLIRTEMQRTTAEEAQEPDNDTDTPPRLEAGGGRV